MLTFDGSLDEANHSTATQEIVQRMPWKRNMAFSVWTASPPPPEKEDEIDDSVSRSLELLDLLKTAACLSSLEHTTGRQEIRLLRTLERGVHSTYNNSQICLNDKIKIGTKTRRSHNLSTEFTFDQSRQANFIRVGLSAGVSAKLPTV